VTNALLEFVSAQAKTGASLVTIGSTPVNFREGRDFFACLSATSDDDLPGLTMLSNEVHRYNCRLSAELIHAGQWGERTLPEGERAWVPSVVAPYHDPKRFREITRAEMLTVIDDFVAATRRCMDSGFDMAMIHYAHGNLLSAFLSTGFNQRTDSYGGSEKNRWRFPLELLEAVYDSVKGRIPLEMRIVGNEHIPGGTPLDERIRFLKEAQKYIDMIVVSAGTLFYGEAFSYNMPSYYIPAGVNVPYAAAFKEACPDLAVSVVGGISTLEEAEEIIKTGKADIVAMAKALMADGDFVTKGRRGQEKEIRPCLRCLYCLKRNNGDCHFAGCAVNPTMGWEYRTTKPTPALKKKKVMVVGGGPAGMAAAQYLTERGHEVRPVREGPEARRPSVFECLTALPFKDGFRRYLSTRSARRASAGRSSCSARKPTPRGQSRSAGRFLSSRRGRKPIPPAIRGIDGPTSRCVSEVDRERPKRVGRSSCCGAGLSGSELRPESRQEAGMVTLVDRSRRIRFYSDLVFFTGRPSRDTSPRTTSSSWRLASAGVTAGRRPCQKRRRRDDLSCRAIRRRAFGVKPDEAALMSSPKSYPKPMSSATQTGSA
jgi:2,4-dienoyl-CoA reductase-like NADH-dependent reductase (Old Yellow Enzyme family)